MHKIYSRFRFRIPKIRYRGKSNIKFEDINRNLKNKKIKKISRILIIFIIAILTANTIYSFINPVFIGICEGKVKAIATNVSNEQATIAIQNYEYEDLFEIEKDNNGKVIMIKSNTILINNIISNVALNIQKELNKEERLNIEIPMGALSGMNIFSGSGPNIKAKLIYDGIVDTDLKSEFISQGINQTLHRVYLQVNCKAMVITSFETIKSDVSNQILFMENVILGEIPNTYYNLEGMKDTVDIIE